MADPFDPETLNEVWAELKPPGRGRHRFARHRDGADDVGAFHRNPL